MPKRIFDFHARAYISNNFTLKNTYINWISFVLDQLIEMAWCVSYYNDVSMVSIINFINSVFDVDQKV